MKKNYFMLAATTMMLAACAQTDVVNEIAGPQQQAISFETFANKATRTDDASPAVTNLETHHGAFSVWASKKLTESEFRDVYGTESKGTVSYVGTEWTASPLKFWDKAALNYYFYAAAPTDAGWTLASTQGIGSTNTVGTDGKFKLINFTLSGTNLATASPDLVDTWKGVNGDKDLMVATPVPLVNSTYNVPDPEKVSFTFRHILSKLNIKVKGVLTVQNAQIELNTLDVVGLKNTADYTESLNECDWNNWENTYTLSAGGLTNSKLILNQNVYVYTHEYLVIPQVVAHTDWMNQGTPPTNGEPYIYIDYNIATTGTGASTENFKSYYSLADIFGNANLNFAEGGQYTLSVIIAPDAIEFETTETAWTQGLTPDINIE